MIPFAERLQETRKKKNLKMKDVAEHFNIPYRTYQNYEGGYRRPDYEMLAALADYFDVTIDYLFGRTDKPN